MHSSPYLNHESHNANSRQKKMPLAKASYMRSSRSRIKTAASVATLPTVTSRLAGDKRVCKIVDCLFVKFFILMDLLTPFMSTVQNFAVSHNSVLLCVSVAYQCVGNAL